MPVMDVLWFSVDRLIYIDGVCSYKVLTLELCIHVFGAVCACMPNAIHVYVWVSIRQFTRRYPVKGENLQPAADI